MSQFRIYGHAMFLKPHARRISAALHAAAVDALKIPESKRFHRFISLDEGMFFTPDDRSEKYVIIECMMFEGRSVATKKAFYRTLLSRMQGDVGIKAQDIELTFIETPRHDWLIRGHAGDELKLDYPVQD